MKWLSGYSQGCPAFESCATTKTILTHPSSASSPRTGFRPTTASPGRRASMNLKLRRGRRLGQRSGGPGRSPPGRGPERAPGPRSPDVLGQPQLLLPAAGRRLSGCGNLQGWASAIHPQFQIRPRGVRSTPTGCRPGMAPEFPATPAAPWRESWGLRQACRRRPGG